MSSTLVKKGLYTTAACLTTASALYYTTSQRRNSQSPKMLPAYEANFSVPITCEGCTDDISKALSKLPGVQETTFSIPLKLVTTKGTEPPSTIISAIQSTGRAAILRGSGRANSAAVCILETPPSLEASPTIQPSPVRGLARLIELGDRLTMLDLTLTGMKEGRYKASVRTKGDISAGKEGMGGVFTGLEGDRNGEIGELIVDAKGRGSLIGEIGWRVWEMVGRGVIVEKIDEEGSRGGEDRVVVGVIARSAGVWENEKVVCGCSGKTVWEEREEMVGRGML